MQVVIPKEILSNERRVAATAKSVKKMVKAGMEVMVEAGAGVAAAISDRDFETAGAKIEPQADILLGEADVVLKVQAPMQNTSTGKHELDMMKEGATVIGFLQPLKFPEMVNKMVERRMTCFSLDFLPRIARAQSMDVLSSMSSLAGYKSVLLAADAFGGVFPMLTTAAGTLYPAQTLILGAGVAGLQAIATARRLGGSGQGV